MRVIFDPETEGVIIDYNKDGKTVSIEILDASEQISEPMGILYELKSREKAIA